MTTLPAGFAKQAVVAIVYILLTNTLLHSVSFVTKPAFHGAGTTMRNSVCSSQLKCTSHRQTHCTVTVLMKIKKVLVQILLPLEAPRAGVAGDVAGLHNNFFFDFINVRLRIFKSVDLER